jgi:choline dehydrogenase-like flavoprotein
MRRLFAHTAGIFVIGEDLPHQQNRVDLDPVEKDSDGIPAARVTSSYSENSVKMLDHGAARARQVLEAAGAMDVQDNGSFSWASHLMGTARMGRDPRRSVVNAWNQSHDIKNLFIVDGSSFTTSAGVNPTSTIGALALRCADGIWQRRHEFT